MITGNIEHNIAAFNSTLERYVLASGKSVDEVLEKKGKDLGIRLYRGFRERQWGGPGRNPRLARSELDARTARGEGTRVRPSLLAAYRRERASMNFFARSAGQKLRRFSGTLDQWSALREARERNRRQRAGLWRATVGKEIGLRQAGIGALAASFLWYRARRSQARGKYIVKNRTGRPSGSVEQGPGYVRIQGFTTGLEKVDARYGVVNNAIIGAMADTELYLARKELARFNAAFARLGKAVAA